MSATSSSNTTDVRRAAPREGQGKTVRVFNVRVAVISIAALMILSPSLYAWHAYQLKRTADAFKTRAEQLESQQSFSEAAGYLRRYLGLHPADHAARVRMTKLYEQGAVNPAQKNNAINLYYQTLVRVPEEEQSGLRCQLAELLLEMRRFSEAETESRRLLAADEQDSHAKRIYAIALYGQIRSGAAAAKAAGGPAINEVFESAIESNPGDIRLSPILAEIYRGDGQLLGEHARALPRAERESFANGLMDRMIEANSEKPEAYLARFRYRVQRGLPGADDDIRSALKYGGDRVDVLLAAAEWTKQNAPKTPDSAGMKEARSYCESLLKAAPKDERGYLLLGNLQMDQGDCEGAVETWRRGLKEANKDSPLLHQRLAETLVALRKANEAEVVLKSLDGIITTRGPLLPSNARAALERSRDFVRAQWWLLKNETTKALPLLKRIAAQTTSPSEASINYEAWMRIGQIHVAQGEPDEAAAAFEQAMQRQPRSAAAKLAAAMAWANAGQFDLAIRYGEQALAIDASSETQFFLADAYCRQQLSLPAHQRNWQLFNKAIAETAAAAAKQPLQNPWRLSMLRANALLAGAGDGTAEESRDAAIALLHAAENDYSNSPALMQMLPLVWERLGSQADADRAADKLEKLPNQAMQAVTIRFRLCMARKQFAQARDVLQAGIKAVPAQSFPLRLALVSVNAAEGRQEEAYQELVRLQTEFPNHLLLLRQLTETADELGKAEDEKRWEDKLREAEGPDGFFWRYYRAKRLLTHANDAADPQFQEAERLANELQSMRPAWPPAHLLLAIVAERQGRIDRAIEACRQALRLGERRTRVYEQLIQLLYAKSRFSEAEEYLAQLREQIPSSEGLSSMEISLATQAGDMKRALAAAQRGVESRPQDPMARVWLGQVQLASGQTEDAEQTLLAAVKAASTDARAYNALFDFYLRTNKSPQAIQVLEDLEKNVAMSAAERAFVFAQAHERLANTEKKDAAEHLKKAREEYGEAQRLAPDNIAVLERRAAFLFPRDPKEAEAVLRRLLEVEPKSLSARRMLATLLAARGGEKEWQESQSLLETPAVQSTVAEQRLQASLLARRGGKDNFAKARGLLDKITADAKQSVPDDFVLLGQILEAEGRVDAARQQYQAVANRAEAAPAHIAQYVDFLLRHDGGAEAAAWLEKLLQRQPDDLRAIALRARWLNIQQRAAEIEPAVEAAAERLLKKAAETNPAKAGSEQATVGNDGPEDGRKMQAAREAAVFQQIGDIYMAAEQYAAAERWYRRLIQSAPTRYAPLVIALQRQNRLNEAAAVCIEAAKTDASAQPAIVLATAFGIGQPTAADFEIAEPLFAKTLESHPDNVELLNTIAGVRVMQRRLDDAIALYRRIVATKPKDVFALNNLATVLAEKAETRQEAIRAIDSAIDVAGQLPALLDTKGTILILDGKAGDAIPLLKEATMAAEVDSRFLFHLALAYDGAGKGDDAKTTLKKARDRKLAQQILTPTDRRLLDELEKKLGI